MSAKEKYNERMKKLRDLHLKRNEARKINHQEVSGVSGVSGVWKFAK